MTAFETEKLDRLDRYLDDAGAAELWLLRPRNVKWLTGGTDTVVERGTPTGVAALGYDGESARAVAPNNEADRMREEELPEGVPVETYTWHERSLPEAVAEAAAEGAAADADVPGLGVADLAPLRLPLTPGDRERLAAASEATADAVETVGRSVAAADTEYETAGRLREELHERGLESPVVLVGGSDRAQRHRHFTPQAVELGAYAVLTVVAETAGLNVAATRTVAFDPPEWLGERHAAASRVAASAVGATREAAAAGGTAGDVFDAIEGAYDAVGWGDQPERHHQGGAIGFESREWTATPGAADPVTAPSPYAWNPTVEGAKSEDTVLVGADGTDGGDGVDVLTDTGEWPTSSYDAVDREFALDLPDVLVRG
ncbi:M24 family metallopeptidase [Candidatus Halobonum tyrrellensis]|uniref:Peptidase M24 n=1 Tax=Candidatus Halobonum tyrrellensis G22 TaxID=1324957 RepID=V4GW37_9EURY|nr:M24 family metallopeptidase [Candidatus Halobonum tyrrellensis]ESP89351.1 peptidase M24 [Candidatus Halobonum tyrrellensis G22]